MKAFFKTFALVAVAVTAFVACQNDVDNNQQVNTGKTPGISSFKFYANTGNVNTKVTLTPNEEETAFDAAWEYTDAMAVFTYGEGIVNDQPVVFDETGTASWNVTDEAFEAFYDPSVTLPTEQYTQWTYKAFYPWYELSYGSERTQNGNNFNSEYDLMYGTLQTSNCKIGENADESPIVIPMNRLTAIAYYHITGGPEEDVVSATLTVDEGKVIAADLVEISEDGTTITTSGGTNSITITFDEGTAPTANNLQLWFNLLTENIGQASAYNVTVDIETTGHTAKLTSKSARSFTAGKLNRAKISSLTWTPKPLFYESFDKCSSTGGNDDSWNGSIANGDFSNSIADNAGWSLVNGKAAKECIKLGTGNAKGSATTPAFDISEDYATLTFKAAAWDGSDETTGLNVSIAAGAGILSESSVILTKGAWTEYTIYIAGAGDDTKIKFEAQNSSKNRFFLDEVKVTPGGSSFDYFTLSESVINVAYTATSASFNIVTNQSWTIETDDDIVITPDNGTSSALVNLSFDSNVNSATTKTNTLTISVGEDDYSVTVIQAADPDAVEDLTIAQFLAKEDDENTNYRVSGTVKSIANANYCNIYITDGDNDLYVYGLKAGKNSNYYASVSVGDAVTLVGYKTTYNTTIELIGYLESITRVPVVTVDPESLSFSVVGGDKTVTVTTANFDDGATLQIDASSDNAAFSTSVSGNTVTVTAADNSEGDDEISGTITITVSDGNNTKTATVAVSQDKPVFGKSTTVTYDATDQGYDNAQSVSSWLSAPISISFNNTRYYTTGNALRVYGGGYFEISTTVGTITNVALTFGTGGDSNEITSNVGDFDSGVWTGAASSVKFNVGGSSGNRRIQTISVTYLDPDATVENPTLTVDENFSLIVGQTKELNVNTNSDGAISYQSSNTSVATVVNGVVTAVAPGDAIITVNVAAAEWYNAASAPIEVTVVAKAVTSLTITGLKTSYATGDDFNASCSVTAHYNDNTSEEINADDYTLTVTKDNVVVTDLTNLAEGTYYATISFDDFDADPIEITVTDGGNDPVYGTITITRSSFPSGSLAYNVTDTWTATATTGETISGQGDLYSTANQTTMQSKNSGVSTMYHNTVSTPGPITKITLTCASGITRTYTAYMSKSSIITSTSGGTSKGTIAPSSGNSASLTLDAEDGWHYFWLNLAGGASYLDSIVIEYVKN